MHCPSREQLEAALAGAAPDEYLTVWSEHIECCERCQAQLEKLTSQPESSPPGGFSNTVTEGEVPVTPPPGMLERWKSLAQFDSPSAPGRPPDVADQDRASDSSEPGDSIDSSASRRETSHRLAPPGYEISGELGRGGMAVVYRARHQRLGREVALKMILTRGHASPNEVARFLGEARTLAQLQHPNIVQIFDIGEHADGPFLALELAEGGSLADQLADHPLRAQEAARILEVLALAVAEVHRHGIIHRDLTPANVLLAGTKHDANDANDANASQLRDNAFSAQCVKIADFGLARRLDGDSGLTATGFVAGTPNYLAPEQASGRVDAVSPAVDIYALGAILYRMLTGSSPFPAATPLDTLHRVMHDPVLPPRRVNSNVPRDLETICLKCLEKSPRQRYASATALADDLRRFLDGRPVHARRATLAETSLRWMRRNPIVTGLTAAVAVLLVAFSAYAVRSTWQLRSELRRSMRAENDASIAKRAALDQLWKSKLAHARAVRFSRKAGHRFDSIEALAEAGALIEPLGLDKHEQRELRNEAIAVLAYPDMQLRNQWHVDSPFDEGAALDPVHPRYAHGSRSGFVSVRSVHDNRELFQLPNEQALRFLRFSPDGELLAAVSPDTPTGVVWKLSDRSVVCRPTHIADCRSLAFSPDSRYLALGDTNSSIIIYDTRDGGLTDIIATPVPAERLAFDPTGTRLAVVASDSPTVRIFNRQTPGSSLQLPHPAIVASVDWRGDGRTLAAGCRDGRIYIWDLAARQVLSALDGHRSNVVNVAFNRGGTLLASQSWDGTTRLWDAYGAAELVRARTLWAHQWNAEGNLLAGGAATAFQCWQVAEARVCLELHDRVNGNRSDVPAGGGPWSSAFSPDGSVLTSASSDGVRFWDAHSGRQLGHLPVGPTESALFQKDGSLLTHTAGRLLRWPISSTSEAGTRVVVVDSPIALPYPAKQVFDQHAGRLAHSDQAGVLALADRGGNVAVVWQPSQTPGEPLVIESPNISDIDVSPDGRWAALGNWDGGQFQVWDLENRSRVLAIGNRIGHAAFSADARLLATACHDEFRVWAVGQWEHPAFVIPHEISLLKGYSAFSRDGQVLAFAHSDRAVQLVRAESGEPLATLEAPEPLLISDIQFNPAGDRLAVATENDIIRLWDLAFLRDELQSLQLDWPLPPYPSRPPAMPVELRLRGQAAEAPGAPDSTRESTAAHPESGPGAALVPWVESRPADAALHYRRGVLYARQGIPDAAALEFRAAYEQEPTNQHRNALAWMFVQSGEVARAAALWRASLAGDPASLWDLYRRAAAALAVGDEAGYREDCSLAHTRFGSTSEPNAWERLAKIGLLSPRPAGDAAASLQLAERAVAARGDVCWYWLAQGLALYRLGRFEASTAALDQGLREFRPHDHHADTQIFALLAMNYHCLGQKGPAAEQLERAVAGLQETLDGAHEHPSGNWHDWLMSWLLLEEARSTIAAENGT